MGLSEKAAYLKGLAEGMGMDESAPNAKLTLKLLDLVSEMSKKSEDLQEQCDELHDYCDELDSDLGDVEEYLFADDEDEDEEYDEYAEDDEDDEEDGTYTVTCPSCGEVICFDESCDPEKLVCPACGEEFNCICDGCEDCDDCDKCEKDD
ncbi:MAG: transposase [Clostridia bacterium]|nr:transposase [Clostridia bacterium]